MKIKKLLSVFAIIALSSTTTLAVSNLFSDVDYNSWYGPSVDNLSDIGIIKGYSDGTFHPGQNVTRAELTVMMDRMLQYIEDGEVAAVVEKYINTKHGYSFEVPDGAVVHTDLIMGSVDYDKADWVSVELSDDEYFNLAAMASAGTFPQIEGAEDMSAQDYLEEWRLENVNSDNPYIDGDVSEQFSFTEADITWYGFTVNGLLEFANDTGGEVIDVETTLLIAKVDGTFYKWQYVSDLEDKLKDLLATMDFS